MAQAARDLCMQGTVISRWGLGVRGQFAAGLSRSGEEGTGLDGDRTLPMRGAQAQGHDDGIIAQLMRWSHCITRIEVAVHQ